MRDPFSQALNMYYDDQARRFNFISGLLLGAVLGTGLALLAVPKRARRKVKGTRVSERLRQVVAGR